MLHTQQLIPTSVNRFTEIRVNIWSRSSKDLFIRCFNVTFFNAGENGLYSKPLPFLLLLFPNLFHFYYIPVLACLLSFRFYLCRNIYLLHFLQLHLLLIIIALNISRWHYHQAIMVRRAKFFTSSGSF